MVGLAIVTLSKYFVAFTHSIVISPMLLRDLRPMNRLDDKHCVNAINQSRKSQRFTVLTMTPLMIAFE